MQVKPDGTVVVSNHSLSLTACDTLATLYALGYRGITSKEAPLQCGIACHEAMADYFVNGNRISAINIFSDKYYKWALNNVPQVDRLAHDNVKKILTYWFDQNPIEEMPFEVIPEFVECSFELPLTSDGKIIFNGRPDAIVKSKKSNKVYIVDLKTTSNISKDFESGFDLDPQMSAYFYVAEQYGLEVAGIFINAIEIKKLSDATSQCPYHKVKRSECALQHIGYKFIPYNRSEELIAAWLKTTMAMALRFRALLDKCPDICYIQRQAMQGIFYKGMCNNCQFFEFCKSNRNPKLAEAGLLKKLKEGE